MSQEMNYAEGLSSSAMKAKALESIKDIDFDADTITHSEAEDTTTETVSVEAEKIEPAPAVVDSTKSDSKVLELGDDALVRVKIDGQVQEVPYKEFKDSLQREAAWHKRQQDFAKGKKELEQFYVKQFAELESAARQLKAYEQALGQLQRQPQTQQNVAKQEALKDEIATLNEVRQEAQRVGQSIEEKIAARDQQINEQIQKAIAQVRAETQQQKETQRFTQMLNDQVLSTSESKVLAKIIPNYEQNLRWEITQLQPESLEEAAEFGNRLVKQWTESLKSTSIVEQQRAEAKKAKAKVEPPDGSPIAPRNAQQPKRKSFIGKDGRWDHKALREAAASLLD